MASAREEIMLSKIKKILGSVRFWIITLTAITGMLTLVELHGFLVSDLMGVITTWLGTVAGVGTLDSIAQNISGTKE